MNSNKCTTLVGDIVMGPLCMCGEGGVWNLCYLLFSFAVNLHCSKIQPIKKTQ